MTVRFEGYTGDGLVRGTLDAGRLDELLEHAPDLVVEPAALILVDGTELSSPRLSVPTDELIAVAAPPSVVGPVHAVWHDITLAAGPYRVDGLLPTVPGFDPGRALARPSGTFVLIGSAEIRLAAAPDDGRLEYPLLWINRYSVDRVEADIELSLYFPGAEIAVSGRAGRPEGVAPPRFAASVEGA